MKADRDRIWRAILEIGTCMMVTRDGEGLRARPMQALAEPDENIVWFLSDRASHKDREITAEPRTCLAFADVENDLYVSLFGQLELVDDRDRVCALLSDDDSGDEESMAMDDLIALRFTPETGEIWDGWSLGDDEGEEGADDDEAEAQAGLKIDFGNGDGKRSS